MLSDLTTDYTVGGFIPIDMDIFNKDYTFKGDADAGNADTYLLLKQQIRHSRGEESTLGGIVETEEELDDTIELIRQKLIDDGEPEESITDEMMFNLYLIGAG